jgi:CheY-like chemotaxis protein
MEDILVVDDDGMMLELVKCILERKGITAHCVSSGEEALAQIKERTFSLMITDFMLWCWWTMKRDMERVANRNGRQEQEVL